MGADVLNNVNAMPAPTWHRLDMNETAVELPEGLSFAAQVEVEAAAELIGEAGAFDTAVAALQERVDAHRLPRGKEHGLRGRNLLLQRHVPSPFPSAITMGA